MTPAKNLLNKLQTNNIELVDSHLHLSKIYSPQSNRLDWSYLTKYLNYCRLWQVKTNLLVTVDYQDQEDLIANLIKYQNLSTETETQLYYGLGYHPQVIKGSKPQIDLDLLKHHYSNQPNLTFMGEIGLDHLLVDIDPVIQHLIFQEQLKVAEQFQLGVNIHAVGAINTAQNLVQELRQANQFNQIGIAHGFNGSIEQAHKWLDLNFLIGVGCLIYQGKKLANVIKTIPLEKIVLETDIPYMANIDFNQPHPLIQILLKLEEIGYDPIKIAASTTDNCKKYFIKSNLQ